ncbi:MAG: glycosyltransferase family 2 protein [Bacilli bacterium]|nr:glycosyltransferase family 2 protein [Bacilli bacterium]
MSKVGIVILNYNDYETTSNMLDNIKNYKSLDNIVVVDNNSIDDSYNILKKYNNKKIDVVKSDINGGYSAGNNFGIKHLLDNYKVDYVIISNPDITVTDDTIKSLINELDKDEKIKVIAPCISELGTIKRGWKLPDYYGEMITILNTRQRFHKTYGLYDENHYKDRLSKVEVVSGCFFIIRSDVLNEIGLFDEGTFLYYEENILGHILKEKGYDTYILNDVTVTHNLSQSVDKSVKKLKKYKILVKSLMYYEKKYNKRNIFSMLFLTVIYVISYVLAYIKNMFKR